MSTHNIGFYEDLTKIIFELSSNTHLISSAESVNVWQCLKMSQMFFKPTFTLNPGTVTNNIGDIILTCPCNSVPTPQIPYLSSKTGVYRGIHYFSSKHSLSQF